jgi:hypothetical protein
MVHGQTLDRIKWGSGVQPSLREAWPQYFPSADLKSTAALMASPREAGRDGGKPSLPSFVR